MLLNHGLPKMVNHSIAQQAKQQSIVHVERTCRLLSCSIVSCQIRQEGGNFLVEETAGVFTKVFVGRAFSKF